MTAILVQESSPHFLAIPAQLMRHGIGQNAFRPAFLLCNKHAHTLCYLVQQSQADEGYLCEISFLQGSPVDT